MTCKVSLFSWMVDANQRVVYENVFMISTGFLSPGVSGHLEIDRHAESDLLLTYVCECLLEKVKSPDCGYANL